MNVCVRLPVLIALALLLQNCSAHQQPRQTAKKAPAFREEALKFEASTITVRYLGNVEVSSVKPYIRKSRGGGSGNFTIDVVIRNTGTQKSAFHAFGEGRAEDGIWFYGGLQEPLEVEPQKESKVELRTRLRTQTLPREIRLQVLEVQN